MIKTFCSLCLATALSAVLTRCMRATLFVKWHRAQKLQFFVISLCFWLWRRSQWFLRSTAWPFTCMVVPNFFTQQSPTCGKLVSFGHSSDLRRCIRVPLCFNIQFPEAVQVHDFEVVMVGDDPNSGDRLSLETYASDEQDPPGLAILDSGCTRTTHGTEWS